MKSLLASCSIALVLAACTDASQPFAVANDGPAYNHTPLILTVTNTEDSGSGSLRAAIAQAVAGDEIRIDAALAGQTITLTSGTLQLDKHLAITAPATGGITIARPAAAPTFGIFEVQPGVTARLENLTIRGGVAPDFPYNTGGGIHNQGNLTLLNSTLRGNHGNRGGAITNIRYYGNPVAALTIINSTVSGNSAANGGAGIYNQGQDVTVTVKHSTITDNHSNGVGDGIYSLAGSRLTIENSIIANNMGDVYSYASLITASHTLIGKADENTGIAAPAENGNVVGTAEAPVDPKLGPLANNGGPSWTHALLSRSPAIDHVPQGVNGCGTSVTTDQRGIARPQNRACDIGSFELAKGGGESKGGTKGGGPKK